MNSIDRKEMFQIHLDKPAFAFVISAVNIATEFATDALGLNLFAKVALFGLANATTVFLTAEEIKAPA